MIRLQYIFRPVVRAANSPLEVFLVFAIADKQEGKFSYKVSIDGVGETTLSYTNKKQLTGDNCRMYRISVADAVIEEQALFHFFKNWFPAVVYRHTIAV